MGRRTAPRAPARRPPGARAARRLAALAAATATLLAGTGCAAVQRRLPALPRVAGSFLPPVVPYAATVETIGARRLARVEAPSYELYAESPTVLPVLQERLDATAREFARHFGSAPRVAVLVFDGPADPAREVDFAPFTARGVQVLAFVRAPRARRDGALGIDEGLLDARFAETFLAAYADSVVGARTGRRTGRRSGRRDAAAAGRAVDRLPHWFAEAVVSRVARPETVEPGVRMVRANPMRLLPLGRLFAMARLRMPTWSELARREQAVRVYREPTTTTPPPLLAAESTAFGEFLVSRYGPTLLQAVADELLAGRPTAEAFAALPGLPDAPTLERQWRAWVTAAR